MIKLPIVLASLGVLTLAATPALAQSKGEEAKEQKIPLSQVPKPAMDAAKQALGGDVKEAEVMKSGRASVYELSAGKDASGKEQAVHVDANGKILKRETESEGKDKDKDKD
jgi:uncharacterized membrane protein YkoI